MEHEQFIQRAIKFLAKYHIEVPEIGVKSGATEKANAKESLYVVSNFANDFFKTAENPKKPLLLVTSWKEA